MYAIIETGGKQFRVQEGNKIVVDNLAAEVGSEVTFDRVLMLGGDTAKIGTPWWTGPRLRPRCWSTSGAKRSRCSRSVAVRPTATCRAIVRTTRRCP